MGDRQSSTVTSSTLLEGLREPHNDVLFDGDGGRGLPCAPGRIQSSTTMVTSDAVNPVITPVGARDS